MNAYSGFSAKSLTPGDIRKIADTFRNTYSGGTLPVDMEAIIEFDLGLKFHEKHGLYRTLQINAFLTADGKQIYVDADDFFNPQKEHFTRYALAHEIGHHQLHSDILTIFCKSTVEDWKSAQLSIPQSDYELIEYQAYEFAGRVLVPPDELMTMLRAENQNIERVLNAGVSVPEVVDAVSHKISKRFGVSGHVISRRILNENIDITKL